MRLSKQGPGELQLTKTKGFSYHLRNAMVRERDTQAIASEFFLSLLHQTGKWFHRVNSVVLKCHKLNKLVHIFFSFPALKLQSSL